MKKVLISMLNRHFKHCVYSSWCFTQKLSDLTNGEYEIREVYNKNNKVKLEVDNTCKIELKLSPSSYILNIDVSEK